MKKIVPNIKMIIKEEQKKCPIRPVSLAKPLRPDLKNNNEKAPPKKFSLLNKAGKQPREEIKTEKGEKKKKKDVKTMNHMCPKNFIE